MNQPDQDQYTLDALYLFPRQTRASYLTQTGLQAPPFVLSQPIKRWQAPSGQLAGKDPNDVYSYKYVDPQTGQYVTKAITCEQAGRINLPGAYDYPKYVIPPTSAVFTPGDPRVPSSPLNADYFSLLIDAQALATELGAGAPFETAYPSGAISYPPQEQRRVWSITLTNGVAANAGVLVKEKNKFGVGAPGHWSSVTNPQWVSELQVVTEQSTAPEMPIPCRDLLPNEVIVQVFMLGWAVQRTDRALFQKVSDSDLMPSRIRDIWNATVAKSALGIDAIKAG